MYEVHVDAEGQLLGSDTLKLEGEVQVGYARVLELRKVCGGTTHPRLSVRKADAALCTAVVLLLLPGEAGQPQRFVADRRRAPPQLVPVLGLGRRVKLEEDTSVAQPSYTLLETLAIGGLALRGFTLHAEMFAASEMLSPDAPDLLCMTLAQLAAELAAREEPKTGRKALLRQRLRAVMIRAMLDGDEIDGV